MIDTLNAYLVYAFKAMMLLFVAYAFLFTLLRVSRRYGLDRWQGSGWLVRGLTGLFLLADWWVNLVISPLLLDLPAHHRELMTDRFRRYLDLYGRLPMTAMTPARRWRLAFARFACRQLDKYDPGHCDG